VEDYHEKMEIAMIRAIMVEDRKTTTVRFF
jgi:hypothetical protein